MKAKLLNDGPQKTYAVILSEDDEVMTSLKSFAQQHHIKAAQFSAIGALSRTTVGFYDFRIKDYKKIEFNEQMEVLAINGDISLYQGDVQLHAHVVLGKHDGTAYGGHLLSAAVHPTLEIILTESPAYLRRELDEASGIPLIQIS